jgi:leucyl aminopeptidase (aminopeptidase T)
MTNRDDHGETELDQSLLEAARNATTTCLAAEPEDRAVVIYDRTTETVASALRRAFSEIGTPVEVFDIDSYGPRPISKLPVEVLRALQSATVSAMAVKTDRGELSARRAVLETVVASGVRHAHMPSITNEVFRDGLSMDYREVARFIEHLVGVISDSTSLTLTSAGGTHLELSYPSPPKIEKLDGLIRSTRWQNLPSGQIIIHPPRAEGVFVADRMIGDWFEHKYDVGEHPVTFEFENGMVRAARCDNRRLERDLRLFIRSSDNSGRISELIIGANLGLTQDHTGALFDGYRPGASLSLGALPASDLGWTSSTFLPLVGRHNTIYIGERRIMLDDAFSDDILEAADQKEG